MKRDTFYLNLNESYFLKGDILNLNTNTECKAKVIKTYPFNWWRKILFKLGFSITSCKMVKCEEI